MTTPARLLLATAAVVASYAAARWTGEASFPSEVRLPERDIRQLPVDLEGWRGEETELDPLVFLRTGSAAAVDRVYRNQAGYEVHAHVAVWTDETRVLPHTPDHCVESAGQEIAEQRAVEVVPGEPPACLLIVELEGRRSAILFWYRLGEHVMYDHDGFRQARWTFRGKKTWPPMVKVMLSTAAPDVDKAEERLLRVARPIYRWTRGI